jgi:membrane protein
MPHIAADEQTSASRPAPDEAPIQARASWPRILVSAAKAMSAHNMPMIAQALAYSTFLAIPSVGLLVIGLFTLLASPGTIDTVVHHLGTVMPTEARDLLSQSLHHLDQQRGATLLVTIVGLVLALWSTTGAMTSYMTAVNMAYDRRDRRGFVKKRLTALFLVGCMGLAFLLVAFFLIFGPVAERYIGQALGIEHALTYVWWIGQWPVLIGGLLATFATLLYLGPDVDGRRWRFLTLGAATAVVVWLGISGAFAFYTAHFGSYNKTWGSLAAVIIMLVWLWLSALALLFGAEVEAEFERSRR